MSRVPSLVLPKPLFAKTHQAYFLKHARKIRVCKQQFGEYGPGVHSFTVCLSLFLALALVSSSCYLIAESLRGAWQQILSTTHRFPVSSVEGERHPCRRLSAFCPHVWIQSHSLAAEKDVRSESLADGLRGCGRVATRPVHNPTFLSPQRACPASVLISSSSTEHLDLRLHPSSAVHSPPRSSPF